jgi:serine/threonine protein phosphatase PrpC
LCSDGLTDMLSDSEIRYFLSSDFEPQQVCDALVGAANLHGGLDNITVVLVEAVGADLGGTP